MKSSWCVRFKTSSGSSIPANCTCRDFFSSSKCGTWKAESWVFNNFYLSFVVIFYTNRTITSQICSAMSSFLRMMIKDEEQSSPGKNSDGCTGVWPSASNCAYWNKIITQWEVIKYMASLYFICTKVMKNSLDPLLSHLNNGYYKHKLVRNKQQFILSCIDILLHLNLTLTLCTRTTRGFILNHLAF